MQATRHLNFLIVFDFCWSASLCREFIDERQNLSRKLSGDWEWVNKAKSREAPILFKAIEFDLKFFYSLHRLSTEMQVISFISNSRDVRICNDSGRWLVAKNGQNDQQRKTNHQRRRLWKNNTTTDRAPWFFNYFKILLKSLSPCRGFIRERENLSRTLSGEWEWVSKAKLREAPKLFKANEFDL